ncbi:hypothetical protein BJV82DRAFT_711292 [Fennellomyces sp. T-0311]|nr:hypothetical protein BJV82DRAFT_711292 [Fennellomyces sp. T-0311]
MATTLRDPPTVARHLGQFMQVTLKDAGGVRTGYLYTVDPTSGNLILFNADPPAALVIMHHAVESIAVDSTRRLNVELMDEWIKFDPAQYTADAEWLVRRRETLVAYLEKCRVPFRHELEDPVIHVLGRARVEPPYVATSVYSDSEVIRDRVREMIMNLF